MPFIYMFSVIRWNHNSLGHYCTVCAVWITNEKNFTRCTRNFSLRNERKCCLILIYLKEMQTRHFLLLFRTSFFYFLYVCIFYYNSPWKLLPKCIFRIWFSPICFNLEILADVVTTQHECVTWYVCTLYCIYTRTYSCKLINKLCTLATHMDENLAWGNKDYIAEVSTHRIEVVKYKLQNTKICNFIFFCWPYNCAWFHHSSWNVGTISASVAEVSDFVRQKFQV